MTEANTPTPADALRQQAQAALTLADEISGRLDVAREGHDDMLERYEQIQPSGRKDKQVSAEERARWSDVAYSRGYRDAMLWIYHSTARSLVPALARDVLALTEALEDARQALIDIHEAGPNQERYRTERALEALHAIDVEFEDRLRRAAGMEEAE